MCDNVHDLLDNANYVEVRREKIDGYLVDSLADDWMDGGLAGWLAGVCPASHELTAGPGC